MRLGIGIISFDRPDYLRRLLASLEHNDCEGVDFHLWQDGAVNRFSGDERADQRDIDRSVRAFERAKLPRKTAHVREENVSIGINQFEAVEWMAERYTHLVIMEDDVVLSPHVLRLVRVLFEEAPPDVFGFSPGFRRACGVEEIEDHLGEVKRGTPHWWFECFTAEGWRTIRPHFMAYYDLIREIDYANLPHDDIRALFKRKGWGQQATSQDGGKDMAVRAAGLRRSSLVVNRGISIGRRGIHWTPEEFEHRGYANQTPYIFAGDAERRGFQWV